MYFIGLCFCSIGIKQAKRISTREKAKSILRNLPPSLFMFVSDSLASSLAHTQKNFPAVPHGINERFSFIYSHFEIYIYIIKMSENNIYIYIYIYIYIIFRHFNNIYIYFKMTVNKRKTFIDAMWNSREIFLRMR